MSREIDTPRPKRFSMIREFHFADWFTLANAICGTGAVFCEHDVSRNAATSRDIYLACAAILAALVFDVLDGRIARWRQTSSALGRELDSLADVISFGVAPAALAYACGMQGFLDRVVLAYFVAAACRGSRATTSRPKRCRAARARSKYFEGTPIPTSIVLVGMLALRHGRARSASGCGSARSRSGGFRLHPLALLFAVSGSLMISRIRIPKL